MNNDSNAGGSIAGFIYQVYYFLYRLLTMQRGETVSLEKIDDVGTETENEEARTYYQLKHTINSGSGGQELLYTLSAQYIPSKIVIHYPCVA